MAEIVGDYAAAAVRGVTLTFNADPDEVRLRFDATLLGRAVRNIIENSLRVSPEGGSVRVRVESDGASARVLVADDGPGVSPQELHRIFEPYFSTHDSGTGLGLPIARRITEEHGGRIAARNLATGGLEVVISLPIS